MSIYAKYAVRQTKLKKRDKTSKTSKRYNEKQANLSSYTVYVKISALTRTAWGLSKRCDETSKTSKNKAFSEG